MGFQWFRIHTYHVFGVLVGRSSVPCLVPVWIPRSFIAFSRRGARNLCATVGLLEVYGIIEFGVILVSGVASRGRVAFHIDFDLSS